MTDTPTAPPATATAPPDDTHAIPDRPSDLLMEFILGLLAPLLMAGCISDIGLARLAVLETVAAYKARGQGELVTIAQIVGFALAALDNLRLSAADDLSLTMKLRLRGNANALNRNSLRASITLDRPWLGSDPLVRGAAEPAAQIDDPGQHDPDPAGQPAASHEVTSTQAQPAHASAAPQQEPTVAAWPDKPAALSADRRRELLWATAMTDVATECAAELAQLSAAQHSAEAIRIGVLSEAARTLRAGGDSPSRSVLYKSRLLGGTSMSGATMTGGSAPPASAHKGATIRR